MRAIAVVMAIIGLVVWLQPLSVAVEAGLLVFGLVCAAYYTVLHRRFYRKKDTSTDSS